MKNSALVVIDLQNDITKNYKEIIAKVNEAVDWAEQKELWIVYIQHNNLSAGTRTFKPGTRGAELVPELHVVSDHIFTKVKSNALTSEAFTAFIQEHGISEFYVVGADAAACIKSTCYNMAKSGYTVHVLSDCITSYDKKKLPELGLRGLSAFRGRAGVKAAESRNRKKVDCAIFHRKMGCQKRREGSVSGNEGN